MKMAALALVPPTSCCQSYFETYVFMRLLVRHSTVLLERPLRQVRAHRRSESEREVLSLWPTAPAGRDICVVCASVCGLRSLVPSGALHPRGKTESVLRVSYRGPSDRAPEESGSTTQEQSWGRRRATVE